MSSKNPAACTGGSASTGSSSGSGSGSGGGGGSGGPCGACKFLRRKCIPGCIFAPYFDSEQGAAHFAAVHKVFGASNASKLLQNVPVHKRPDAVVTICYEAQARLRDPVYGCVAHIFALQQQAVNLQTELSCLQGHLASLELPAQPLLPPPPPPPQPVPHSLSMDDLPIPSVTASINMPSSYDFAFLLNPTAQPSSWASVATMLGQLDPRQYSSQGATCSSGVDLQAFNSELLRHIQGPPPPPDAS